MARLKMLQPRLRGLDNRSVKPPPKQADAELGTRDWKAMRERVFREAGGRCQVPGCTRPGRYVDHIVERRDGGAVFDRANLMLACPPCHQNKTNVERAKRMSA